MKEKIPTSSILYTKDIQERGREIEREIEIKREIDRKRDRDRKRERERKIRQCKSTIR